MKKSKFLHGESLDSGSFAESFQISSSESKIDLLKYQKNIDKFEHWIFA
jgi:hypothetical protein